MKQQSESLKNRMMMSQWILPILVMVLEVFFHWEIYGCFDIYMLYAVFLSLPFSAFAILISNTSNSIWNKAVRCGMFLLFILYYVVQIVYHQVFGNFLSLKSILNGAQQAMDFGVTIWEAVAEHKIAIVVAVVLWVLYVVLEMCCSKKQSEQQKTEMYQEENSHSKFSLKQVWKSVLLCIVVMVCVPILMTCIMMVQGIGFGSTYDIKISFHRTEQSMYRLGLVQTLKKDVVENFCDAVGVNEKQINTGYLWIEEAFFADDVDKFVKNNVEKDTETQQSNIHDAIETSESEMSSSGIDGKERGFHSLDIDFETLIADAENEDMKDVHTYFSTQIPTKENTYTGLFEGYNLIYITAESFSDVVIDKDRTPTLYRMQQEGFQFNNFYTPSWYLSTIDGEYVNCLGQIPVEGDWSLQHSAENVLPTALGNQLKQQGYVCNAYHNHDSYYYDRTITHPKLGYTFKAVGAGLTFESMYPESDLELMEITVDEYIHQEKAFHTYYMTMSGHLPYTYAYNSMAVKNRDVVKGDWSENAACYLAANTELEYALSYLVERLEQAGKLGNTLFVIAPDHYPYGLKKGAYDELQGKEVEKDDFEIYRNGCLIWSASMKDMKEVSFPVQVDKYCSNLDLLPTISNLMGLSYDSRLLAGRDMLSEEEGLVLFKDRSFLTSKVRYNATTGEVIWENGVLEDSVYLESIMQQVQNRFYYSGKILETDYYNQIK